MTLLLLMMACSNPFAGRDVLNQAVREAATTYDVPRDLLLALGWTATRLESHEDAHDHGLKLHGVMGLRDRAESGPSLEGAARLLGVSPGDVAADVRLNVLGLAAQLREQADLQEAATGLPVDDLSDWAEVVGWVAGVDHAGLQRSWSVDVYRWMEKGFTAELASGELVVLEPRAVDVPGLDLVPMGSVASDYGGTALFIAADSGNYSNASRGTGDIDMVVIHTAQGSYSGTAWWFADSAASASAHYVLRSSDGEVTQMVWEEDVAWHAGHSDTNWRSIGIEQEGYIEDPEKWYTDAMYSSLAALVDDICTRYGVPRDRDHIIGHVEVPGCSSSSGGGASCHTDPGEGFDWDYFMDLLGGSGSTSGGTVTGGGSTGELVGFVREGSIYDDTRPVSGASVALSVGLSTTTNTDGWFSFDAVPAGSVDLTVTASGYDDATATKEVSAGVTNWNSMALTAATSTSSSPLAPFSPSDWESVAGPEVTLDWTSTSANRYQVQIWWYDGASWDWYTSYRVTESEKTFWPVVDDTWYAWAVRERSGSGWGPWEDVQYFWFEN